MPRTKQRVFEEPSLRRKPSNDEIEITLFGKGVGECIVMHLGFGRYVTIDSFVNSETKNPIALDYLESLGVSAKSIDYIIVTHWHKDHVLGIAKLANEVSSTARFVMPAIINDECFVNFLEINRQQLNSQSPVAEFCSALKIIEERDLKIVLATKDRLLMQQEVTGASASNECISLYALSPNDTQLFRYQTYMKQLVVEQTKRPSYTSLTENEISIALWLDFVNDRALLGGDLEKDGWKEIVDNKILSGKASLFKVPHHGSPTGYLDEVWKKLLVSLPVALLSVYAPSGLPADDDVQRVKEQSKGVFVAGSRAKVLSRPEFFKKLRSCSSVELRSLDTPIGIVRARKPVNSTDDWVIECFGHVQRWQ